MTASAPSKGTLWELQSRQCSACISPERERETERENKQTTYEAQYSAATAVHFLESSSGKFNRYSVASVLPIERERDREIERERENK